MNDFDEDRPPETSFEKAILSRRNHPADRPHSFLGLPRTLVPGVSRINIIAAPSPPAAFQPTHLIIPREIAVNFQITHIFVGKTSQFLSADPIPASTFGGDVVVLRDQVVNAACDLPLSMRMHVIPPGQSICITVENLCPYAVNFYGAVAGHIVE